VRAMLALMAELRSVLPLASAKAGTGPIFKRLKKGSVPVFAQPSTLSPQTAHKKSSTCFHAELFEEETVMPSCSAVAG
jgi:hypothetical protein